MNQILKKDVYGLGNKKHVQLIAELGGMTDVEAKILEMYHEGKPDQVICDEIGLTEKSFREMEEAVRKKVLLGVFYCLNFTMRHDT